MEKFVKPQISRELSLYAFNNAKTKYNEKVCEQSTLKLKRSHFQTMVLILNDLISWQEHKNKIFPECTILNEALNGKLPALNYNTTLKALQTDSHRQTVRRHLKRLETAGVIETIFHGSKKPLEIKFNPEIFILFDSKNQKYIPKSKFLAEEKCKMFIEKYFDGIKPKSTGSDQNLTNCNNNNVCLSTNDSNNITINEKDVLLTQNVDYYLNNNTIKQAYIPKTSQTKLSNNIINSEKNSEEEKEKNSAKKEKEKLLPTKSHRDKVLLDSIWTYAMIFYAYICDKLFLSKKNSYSDDYKIRTINYIAQNYFSAAQNGKQCAEWFEYNYKIRIDIAQNYIKSFKQKSGREFDTKDFNPLAYLNIDDCENKFRFRNTGELLQRNKQWKALNENKKLKNQVQKNVIENDNAIKFYNIIRQVENQRITYETALEKIRSINMNEQIFTLMLQAKFTGEMSLKYANNKE